MSLFQGTRKNGTPYWRCNFVRASDNKRLQPRFNTEAEALAWLAKMQEEKAAFKAGQRNKSAKPTAAFLAARVKNRTLASALDRACRLDWAYTKLGQERGFRVCNMIGMNTPITEITTETYDDIVEELLCEERSTGTIKVYCSALTVILKRAKRLKWIPEQLPLTPEGRSLPAVEKKDLVIQRDWFEHQMAFLKVDEHRLLTEFLWHIGCRVSEALNLTWDRVTLTDRRIQFVETKTLNPRRLPISGDVEQILLACRKLQGNRQNSVFQTNYKKYRRDYKQATIAACKTLGLGEKVMKQWGIHTLRHTQITRGASAGWQAAQIMQWAGHKSLKTSQGYIKGSAVDLDCLVSVEPSQVTNAWELKERSF